MWSSASVFTLDEPKILLFGKELIEICKVLEMIPWHFLIPTVSLRGEKS